MLFGTDYLHSDSGSKTNKAEKKKKNRCGRGMDRNKIDTKRNAICAMASCFHFYKLDFAGGTCLNSVPTVFLTRINNIFSKQRKTAFLWTSASFTVEASLIMMIVIMAIFLCMYYGFFLHDKTILEEVSSQAAHKAMFFVTENSDMEEGFFDWEALQKKGLLWRLAQNTADTDAIHEYVNRRVSGELFSCDMPEFSVTSNSGNVQITYRAHIRLPLFSIMRAWGVPSEITGGVQVREAKQEEFIRLIRGIIRDKEQDEKAEGG